MDQAGRCWILPWGTGVATGPGGGGGLGKARLGSLPEPLPTFGLQSKLAKTVSIMTVIYANFLREEKNQETVSKDD